MSQDSQVGAFITPNTLWLRWFTGDISNEFSWVSKQFCTWEEQHLVAREWIIIGGDEYVLIMVSIVLKTDLNIFFSIHFKDT